MTIHELDTVLLVGSAVLLVAVAAVRLSVRSGLPSLLLYVALGVGLGESGLGIRFDDPQLTRVLGYVALVIILAEGGLTTPWQRIRPAIAPAALLATVGVAVSVAVTSVPVHLVLHFDWPTSLLVGAVVASTDAAAVFSVLRRVPLPPRLAGLLEAESGFNDAPAVILVVALSGTIAGTSRADNGWLLAALVVLELAVGAGVGLVVGRVGGLLMRRIALPASGLYPVAGLALVGGAYGLAAVAHGSGFLATYLAALVLGNSHLPHRATTRSFAEGLAWLAQIGLFVMLGLLAVPSRLPGAIVPALGIGAVLLLLARPLSVLACMLPFRLPWRHQAFLSWAGLRGAVPIVLATVPVVDQMPRAQRLFDVVFVLVVLLTLVQAPTLPLAARRLRLVGDDEPRELDVEALPLMHLDADMLQVTIPPGSLLAGVEVFELRLPAGAALTLVVRDGRGLVPDDRFVLTVGDELLLVATGASRELTERRLRAVSEAGRLARWGGRR